MDQQDHLPTTTTPWLVAQPLLQLSGLDTGTTISDLIMSYAYQHHTQTQVHKIEFLMYDQEKHKSDELVKDIL